jgi:hypothetical protein
MTSTDELSSEPDKSTLARRQSVRSRAFLGGRIVFNGGNSTVDCQIRDISEEGARLQISGTPTLPGEFSLQFLQQGVTRRVRMVRRTEECIGVVYVDRPDASALDPERRLVRENRELKAEILRLQARILELTQG